MGVLRYTTASSSAYKFASLSSGLANVPTGAWTMAALFRRASTGAFHALGYLHSGTAPGVVQAGFSADATNTLRADLSTSPTGQSVSSTTEIYLGVVTKAAGTVAPIFHLYTKSNNTWATPITGGSTVNNNTAATFFHTTWQNGDFPDCWIGLNAVWSGAMSTANVQALSTNWQTSDFYNSAHGQPLMLVEGNVAGTSLVDLIGNATSLTATALGSPDAAETLSSFNFNGVGAPALIQQPYASAMSSMRPSGLYL